MPRRSVPFLLALVCLAAVPLTIHAQQASAPVPARAAAQPGPRLQPDYPRYEPVIAHENTSVTTAAAADRTTITISTLALVLLIVLLVILIA
jgi:hypothetical protein